MPYVQYTFSAIRRHRIVPTVWLINSFVSLSTEGVTSLRRKLTYTVLVEMLNLLNQPIRRKLGRVG